MYTQCPECLTIYEIDEDALQASLGIVHCGRCRKRFDALRTLSDTLPLEPLAPLPEHDPAERAPTLTQAVPPSASDMTACGRHPPGDASDPATASQPPPATLTSPGESADDWFAGLESELTATSVAARSDAAAPDLDDHVAWAVELPDETEATGWDPDPGLPVEARDAGVAMTPVAAAFEPDGAPAPAQADEAMPQEFAAGATPPATVSEGAPSRSESDPPPVDAASPLPPEDDVPDMEIEASTPANDATEDIGVDTPAADAPMEASADAKADSATPGHVYVPPRGRRISTAAVAWAAGSLALALVLAAQLGWANRVELFRNPATRPWMVRTCQAIPCRLPPIKDTARLELLARDIRPDPNAADALMITATVRNDASFRQPWPIVVVELTDLDNRVVAMRRFRPAEYMPDATRRAAGIAPGATAALAFEVADPGKNAVAFQFSFE